VYAAGGRAVTVGPEKPSPAVVPVDVVASPVRSVRTSVHVERPYHTQVAGAYSLPKRW
jgi:hypothetical protein